MKTRQYASLCLAILLVVFGLLQINDPDFYIWTPAYLITAYFPFQAFRTKYRPIFALRYAMILFVWLLFYFPELIGWIQDGLPNIAASMQAESLYIEFVREFFGLVICISVCVGHYFRGRV